MSAAVMYRGFWETNKLSHSLELASTFAAIGSISHAAATPRETQEGQYFILELLKEELWQAR